MKHTIEKMKAPMVLLNDSRKETIMNGYAFVDEMGGTIIIVYGEGYRDLMSKYLDADGDLVHIKYKCYGMDRRKT
jgi:hypothetical protein